MSLEVLAVICARISSKRLPKKNIALVNGKPLIYYTIKAALEAKLVSRVIVSTESQEVAEIAKECGAEVPFWRPMSLAEDHVQPPEVCLHALQWLSEREGYEPDYVMNLNPTSPLRTSVDIDGMVQMAQEKNADAVYAVSPIEHRSSRAEFSLGPDGRVTELSRRNVLAQGPVPALYSPGVGMCLIRPAVLAEARSFFPPGFYGYVVPRERSLDIDLPWHLHLANLILADAALAARGKGIE